MSSPLTAANSAHCPQRAIVAHRTIESVHQIAGLLDLRVVHRADGRFPAGRACAPFPNSGIVPSRV